MFNRKITTDILKKLRILMKERLVDAYLVPMGDAHDNEYRASCDDKISFISGFTGSAGTVVITENKAALWTDGRYHEQAANQLDNNWVLMKYGVANTPTQADWLNHEIRLDAKVGMYKYQLTMEFYQQLSKNLYSQRSIEALEECLVTKVWTDRPMRPSNPMIILPESFTGKSWRRKIDTLRQIILGENLSGLFLSALDEIAWLFNLRGSDIPHSPVFFSFCFVTEHEIHLFVDRCKIDNSPGLCNYLFDQDECMEGKYKVDIHPYNDIKTRLTKIAEHCTKVWIDPRTVYGLVMSFREDQRYFSRSPIAILKAIKFEEEIDGMKKCNIEDSVALCQFFYWLETEIAMGRRITESAAAEELDRLRSQLPGFYSLSFDTISCSGCNGGLIHYRAVRGQDSLVTDKAMYLCDSGGQYLTGTTDVTRTIHLGIPSPEEIHAYTLVAQGHIALASLVFPEESQGTKLDSIARMHLWRHGMDYKHGTGHGVGAFLNVHEGPCGLSSSRPMHNEAGLMENMVLTIEPGFYMPQKYGIRIENDYVLTKTRFTDHYGQRDTSVKFLQFEPLTFFPIQTKLLDKNLLSAADVKWLNDYHQQCRDKLGDVLRARGLVNESRWLLRETEPISNI